jgi:hypothetical protein
VIVKLEKRLNAARRKKNAIESKMRQSLQNHESHAQELRERRRYEEKERINNID